MWKCVALTLTVVLACAGSWGSASAMPKWEKDLLKRYAHSKPCDGRGAPAWGKASMQRWRAAQRAAGRY
jgi:hypothetical protein